MKVWVRRINPRRNGKMHMNTMTGAVTNVKFQQYEKDEREARTQNTEDVCGFNHFLNCHGGAC